MKTHGIFADLSIATLCIVLLLFPSCAQKKTGGAKQHTAGTGKSKTEITDFKAEFEKERAKILKGPEEMKKMLADIQTDIKKRNLKFTVEVNEIMGSDMDRGGKGREIIIRLPSGDKPNSRTGTRPFPCALAPRSPSS